MKVLQIGKNRIVLILLVILISLGLVGVALAAAGQTGRSITDGVAVPPQVQAGWQPDQALPPSPIQTSYEPPMVQSPPDPLMEQMRQQAMSASQAVSAIDRQQPNAFTTDAAANSTSMAPLGAGTTFLPGGIVVDTYIDYIYGNSTPYVLVNITRVADDAYGASETDDVGFFWTSIFDGLKTGVPMNIQPGDQLNIDGNLVSLVGEPVGSLDVLADLLDGNIAGVPEGTVVTVTLGLYGQTSLAYGINTTQTDINGDFSIDFAYDIGPENFATVDYQIAPGVYQRSYLFPENVFTIQQHGMISGYAPQKTNIHATVFVGDSGEIRWQGDTSAGYPFGWFTLTDVTMDIGDKVVVDFPDGSTEIHYVYSSNFTFSGDDTVNGNVSVPGAEVRVSFLAWNGAGYTYHEKLLPPMGEVILQQSSQRAVSARIRVWMWLSWIPPVLAPT